MTACITAAETLYKQPSETRTFTMDFSALMVTAETIDSSPAPIITSAKINGDATDLTIGSPTISGQTVTFTIAGGTHNSKYRIEMVIETDASQILEGDGILSVKDK